MLDANTVAVLLLIVLPIVAAIATILYDFLPWVARARQEAQERAELLVRSVLSVEEYRQLATNGYLEVPSPSNPHRIYRIPPSTGMVLVIEGGKCVERLCAQSTAPIPDREALLIHKLMIEANEQEYLRIANHFPCLS